MPFNISNSVGGSINQRFRVTVWVSPEKFHIYIRNNHQKYFFNIMYIHAATLAYANYCKWPYSTLYLYSERIFLNKLTLNGTCFNQNFVLIPNMLLFYFWKLYFFAIGQFPNNFNKNFWFYSKLFYKCQILNISSLRCW